MNAVHSCTNSDPMANRDMKEMKTISSMLVRRLTNAWSPETSSSLVCWTSELFRCVPRPSALA